MGPTGVPTPVGENGFRPIKVVDVELSEGVPALEGLHGYASVQALVRLHGDPLEYVLVQVRNGRCSARSMRNAIVRWRGSSAIGHLVDDSLLSGIPPATASVGLGARHTEDPARLPSMTVAVCTRARPEDLTRCLDALEKLDYPDLELMVVDNAPATDAARAVVAARPRVRYAVEPRPGLDWARNKAIAEARGDVIAFTDDDVVVDRGWARALGRAFAESDSVMAVTGLVVPLEIETRPQLLFERAGGFGRGFVRTWYRLGDGRGPTFHFGPGRFGTGANMAFRRSVFGLVGDFDPALGAGTATNGGDDLEMFFRVIQEGHTLVYEPSAIVRHRHRRDYEALGRQLRDHGLAFYAYLVRSMRAYPELRGDLVRFGVWWFWRRDIRRLLISYLRPQRFPRDLIVAELRGALVGITRYGRAQREAARIEKGSAIGRSGPLSARSRALEAGA
jgi:O-antigen biosynthesis protein